MDLQLKNSSLEPARTAHPDLQHSDSSTETASTSMPAAHHQDSPFFRLPLELRYMIYKDFGTEIALLDSWVLFSDTAPHEFKFWKIMLSIGSIQEVAGRVIVDIDLRRKTIRLLGKGRYKSAAQSGFDGYEYIYEPLDNPSRLLARAFEEPFATAIQAAGKDPDSDGFTFDEIRQLVNQVVLPGREHFESLDKSLKAPLLDDK
ncbi:hypothetical protein KCU65_g1786, partial [Aureobasidium melanogenum]